MLSIIEKLKTWKIILENSWKNGAPFDMQVELLERLGKFICTLALKN